jgi:hypothetical protein
MLWKETIIKSSDLDELVAYMCGLHNTSVKELYLDHQINRYILELNNGQQCIIKHEKMNPSLTHYILDNENDEGTYISGEI